MPSSILLVAHAFKPSQEPGAQRPWRFYRYLPAYGYLPLVLTASAQDPARPNEGVRHTATDPQPLYSLEGFLDRFLTRYFMMAELGDWRWVREATATAAELHGRTPFTIVLSSFPPLAVHQVAMQLKRKLGVKWVADFRDPLGGNPYRRTTAFHGWVDSYLERRVFKHADALIANTDVVLEDWKKRFPQYSDKMHLIWNGYDPEDRIAALPLPVRTRRVLGHIGSSYGDRHPGLLIESLQRLTTSGQLASDSVQLLLQGTIGGTFERYAGLRQELKERGVLVENNFLIPKQEAQRLLGEVDSLVLLDTPGERPSQVPAKIFEYMQIGRPILAITAEGSPVDRLLDESGIPNVRLHYGSSEAEIDTRLLAFLKLPTEPVHMAESFAAKFDGNLQTRQLARILDQISA